MQVSVLERFEMIMMVVVVVAVVIVIVMVVMIMCSTVTLYMERLLTVSFNSRCIWHVIPSTIWCQMLQICNTCAAQNVECC